MIDKAYLEAVKAGESLAGESSRPEVPTPGWRDPSSPHLLSLAWWGIEKGLHLGEGGMGLEPIGVTQAVARAPEPFQIRLKFGKQAYRVMEVRCGEDVADVARKLRELAARVEARSK